MSDLLTIVLVIAGTVITYAIVSGIIALIAFNKITRNFK